jgi:4-amino-4-deoxy-L-arabinose transferase-like glycosyltransferase
LRPHPRLYAGAGIFALAFALRYAWVTLLDIGLAVDAWSYFTGGTMLASGRDLHNFLDPSSYKFAFPPGYSFVLSAVFVVFGSDVRVAQVFNVVVGAITAVLVYVLAARLRDERTGLAAGLLMALFPSQIYFTSIVMTETLFTFLAVVLLLLLAAWLRSSALTAWQVLALGVLLGFMSLVRAETMLLAPSIVVLWWLCGQRWEQIGRSLLILVVGMTLMIAPWAVRNYIRTDQLSLIRGSSDAPARALRVGLSPDFYSKQYILRMKDPMTPRELARHYATHPWEAASHVGQKLTYYFGQEDAFYWIDDEGEIYITHDEAARWSILADAYYYVVGLTVVLGAPLWWRRGDRRLYSILWFAIAWSALHLVFAPVGRYHYPILPMLSVLAAMTLMAVWERATSRSPASPAPRAVETAAR